MDPEELKKALVALGYEAAGIHVEGTSNRNVGGFVVSPKFEGRAQLERQRLLWSQMETVLSNEQLQRVVSVLTMTPAEVEDEPLVANG